MGTLYKEENIISLRTGYVGEYRNIVSFSLSSFDSGISAPNDWQSRPTNLDWVSRDYVYLYRNAVSPAEERELMRSRRSWELQLKPLKFDKKPEFRLCWSDSGQSVALYLNDDPWAFIYEETRSGYSKGILPPSASAIKIGNQWDQELFEKIFQI